MLLSPALALLLALAPQQGVRLPAGPVARAWAGVGPQTAPTDLGIELFADVAWLADPGAADPEVRWAAWSAWLSGEARSEESDPRRRTALALLAREQGRWADAWFHFERLAAHPEWAAAVMPRLLPGVPAGGAPGRGGLPGALPDGVLLRPAPPPEAIAENGLPLRTRTASVEGLRIGEAIVTLRVTIEPSGIEIDLLHTGGGPATVRVLLPEPVDQEIRVEYTDWMREDEVGNPLTVVLNPGDEEHNLYGRFRPRRSELPGLPPGELSEGLKRGGLWIECALGAAIEPEARAAAKALGEVFAFPHGLCRPGEPPPGAPWAATVVHLPADENAALLLARIASMAERKALGGR